MIDRFTKAILTVIAVALSLLVVENAVQPSQAQMELQKVQICDAELHCADLHPMDPSSESWGLRVTTNR